MVEAEQLINGLRGFGKILRFFEQKGLQGIRDIQIKGDFVTVFYSNKPKPSKFNIGDLCTDWDSFTDEFVIEMALLDRYYHIRVENDKLIRTWGKKGSLKRNTKTDKYGSHDMAVRAAKLQARRRLKQCWEVTSTPNMLEIVPLKRAKVKKEIAKKTIKPLEFDIDRVVKPKSKSKIIIGKYVTTHRTKPIKSSSKR